MNQLEDATWQHMHPLISPSHLTLCVWPINWS